MFTVNMVVSVLMFVAMYVFAPYIAAYFERDELTLLCRVMGIVIIINALSIVQTTILTKRIDFKTKAKASLVTSLLSGAVGIAFAYTGYGVWALVVQQISAQLLNCLCLWLLIRWVPGFTFSLASLRSMWGFGSKLMVSGLINQLWTQIYQVVIGKCYSPATLGQFTRAQQFGGLFSSNLNTVIQRVSYPVLSQMQDDPVRLKLGYQKLIKIITLITFTLMMGLAGCARPLVLVLIGEQWLECVPYLQILCFSLMLYPLHSLNLNMLQVQGRSDLFLKLEVVKKVIAIVPILMGIFYGIYYMLICSVFTSLVALYLNAHYSGPFLGYSIREQVFDFLPSLLMSLVMFVLLFAISYISLQPLFLLVMQIFVGALFTLAICEFRTPSEYLELKSILHHTLNRH